MSESYISPSQGHVIAGVIIDDHTFDGKVKAAQLFQFAEDPRRTEDERAYRTDPTLQNLRRVRFEVQRLFTGEKRKNVEPYARDILNMYEGSVGITPTIVLWSSTPLMQDDRGDGKTYHSTLISHSTSFSSCLTLAVSRAESRSEV